jgi:Fe-S cluster assembly iron-binding protein IscA
MSYETNIFLKEGRLMMTASEKALEKLKEELVKRISSVGLGFRVYQDLDGSGIPKLALKLDKKSPNDETIEADGVRLFLDPISSSQLKDLELDYLEGPTGGFVLKNNNKA